MTGKTRADSLVRMAFSAAADGHQTEIAVEAFPTTQYPTSLSKVSRCLLPDGDMNSPWQLLDEILAVNGGAVLRVLCEGMGYEEPRRKELDTAHELAALNVKVSELVRELGAFGRQYRELEKVRRVDAEAR